MVSGAWHTVKDLRLSLFGQAEEKMQTKLQSKAGYSITHSTN